MKPPKKKQKTPFRDGVRRVLLTFGKFIGKEISDPIVTEEYIQLLMESSFKTAQACKEELDRRAAATSSTLGMTEQIATEGYKALAKKYHPDVAGGNNEKFIELQGSYGQLKSILSEVKGIVK